MATDQNPKDSMKSTWRTAPRESWNWSHWVIEIFNAYPIDPNKEVPVHSKDDKIPYMTESSVNLWILFYASLPLLLQQLYGSYMGHNLGPISLFALYFAAFNGTIVHEVNILRRLGHTYGFLDGDKYERDSIPDVGTVKIVLSLFKTTGFRLALSIYLSYQANQLPSDMNWMWLPLETGLYAIVLDFWFYVYHRLMHHVGFLWKFHRTHHLTKHPNPLMTAYADHEQEFWDMVGVPILTYFTFKLIGFPLGFYDWWICEAYIVFTEVLGHSGLRLHMTAASTLNWLLKLFDADIVIEDHDLHHRKGWRKSHNYGKQTRLWDRIFGTCHERIESVAHNVDYVNTARMPLF